jgi:hypothetical protein
VWNFPWRDLLQVTIAQQTKNPQYLNPQANQLCTIFNQNMSFKSDKAEHIQTSVVNPLTSSGASYSQLRDIQLKASRLAASAQLGTILQLGRRKWTATAAMANNVLLPIFIWLKFLDISKYLMQ